MDGAGPGVAAVLTSKFTKVEAVDVVERERIAELTAEIELGQSGLVDPRTAAEAGRILGADFMVFGSIFSAKLPSVAVTLWVVEVETGKVIASQEVRGEVGERGEEFFVLIDELAFAILDALQLRLAARDRIAFGEVDVRKLDTVDVYGRALEALESGNAGDAKQLLSKAVSLEPEFTLAEEALTRLAAEVSSRRSVWAHEAITTTKERWARLDARIAPALDAKEITPEVLAHRALIARRALMNGEFDRYFELEEQRIADTQAYIESTRPDTVVPGAWPRDFSPNSDFWRVARDLLKELELGNQASWQYSDLFFFPWEIRTQLADTLFVLGEPEQAMALAIDNYQHPGFKKHPSEGPPHPQRVSYKWELWPTYTALTQQEVRKAELAGDKKALVDANDDLDKALTKVEAHKRRVDAYEATARKLTAAPRDAASLSKLVQAEVKSIDSDVLLASGHALKGYRAYLARVESGVYEPLRTSSERRYRDLFEDLAEAWRKTADAVFHEHWFVEQRLQNLLTYQEQVPPEGAEEEERYRERVESAITGGYRL